MGYELHIRRADQDNKIRVEEWLQYIDHAPDFEKIDKLSATLPKTGKKLEMPVGNCGLWTPYANTQVPFTFHVRSGTITVKHPDDLVLKKMIEMSKELNAGVFDDDGEEYR